MLQCRCYSKMKTTQQWQHVEGMQWHLDWLKQANSKRAAFNFWSDAHFSFETGRQTYLKVFPSLKQIKLQLQ